MKKKIEKSEIIEDLSGPLRDLKTQIDMLIDTYGEDAEVAIGAGYEWPSFEIIFKREETDKEYNSRLKKEEAATTKKRKLLKQKELQQYKKLKLKYEGK